MRPNALKHAEFGSIITIRHELPFGGNDLTSLLDSLGDNEYGPYALPRITEAHDIFDIPQQGLALRLNYATVAPNPSFDRLVPYTRQVNREFDRLRNLGMTMLRRSVFVVEHDPFDAGDPVIYTVAERRQDTGTLLKAKYDVAFGALPTTQRTLLRTATAHATYFDVSPRQQVLYDTLGVRQCFEDGTLFDYDPYLTQTKQDRAAVLEMLETQSDALLVPSEDKARLLTKIRTLREQIGITTGMTIPMTPRYAAHTHKP